MGRKPLPPERLKQQIKVALAPDMRAWLEREATRGGFTIADEIRRRLWESWWKEAELDWQTRRLGDCVLDMAEEVESNYASWHSSAKAREALAAAILQWLELESPTTSERDPFGSADDPQTAGRMIGRSVYRKWSGKSQETDIREYELRMREREDQEKRESRKRKPKKP